MYLEIYLKDASEENNDEDDEAPITLRIWTSLASFGGKVWNRIHTPPLINMCALMRESGGNFYSNWAFATTYSKDMHLLLEHSRKRTNAYLMDWVKGKGLLYK